MTVLNPDTQTSQPKTPEAKDTNVSHQTNDPNISQQKFENPTEKQQQEKKDEASEDPNWRAFREARKRDRSEKEAAEKRAAEKEQEIAALKAAMEAAFTKSSPSTAAYQQYYGMNEQTEETDEQRLERKVNEILAHKQQQFEREMAEKEQREYPSRLAKDFPDFRQVCSQENLDYLDFHFPEISRPLQRLSEGYDKWSDIYHAVKKLIPSHSSAKKEAMRAEINNNKPRSISSPELTQSGQPVRETWQQIDQRRAENWARMQRTMKGV